MDASRTSWGLIQAEFQFQENFHVMSIHRRFSLSWSSRRCWHHDRSSLWRPGRWCQRLNHPEISLGIIGSLSIGFSSLRKCIHIIILWKCNSNIYNHYTNIKKPKMYLRFLENTVLVASCTRTRVQYDAHNTWTPRRGWFTLHVPAWSLTHGLV